MKRFPLLPQVALVFAVVYACTDSTAPARFLAPKDPAPVVLGDPPPPPVDAAINITITSTPFTGAFDGVYFANGTSIGSAVAAQNIGDESLTFLGTAWLRLDNVQPELLGTKASANARFQRTEQKLFGMGTLVIGGVTVRIDRVTSFRANPTCGVPGELCAVIVFDASILTESGFESGHTGTAEAFDSEFCEFIPPDEESDGFYDCPGEEAPADLTVAQFSVSPTNPTTSDLVVYTIVISNAGETDAPASEGTLTEGWSRTVEGFPEAGGSVEPGIAVPAVPAGGSVTLTFTRGPLFVASWGATFTVNTGTPSVPESNGANNADAVSFTVSDIIIE